MRVRGHAPTAALSSSREDLAHTMSELPPGEETIPATRVTEEAETTAAPQWAIVEIFGHRRHVGVVSEAEQFGSKMLRIDVPGTEPGSIEATFFYGGASIFGLTPITEARGQAELARIRGTAAPARLGLRPDFDDPDLDALDDPESYP